MQTVTQQQKLINPLVHRARRRAYRLGLRMLAQKDGRYRLTRFIHLDHGGQVRTEVVASDLTAADVIFLCSWIESETAHCLLHIAAEQNENQFVLPFTPAEESASGPVN
jgi:hypothetical protein